MILQGVPRHDVIGLVARTSGTEMPGKDFKEGSIPTCLIDASATFQISRMKFP